MASSPQAADGRGSAPPREQSKLYKLVVTPVIFVSFVFALAWVDFCHLVSRSGSHRETAPGWMPGWLRHFLYRERPYQYVGSLNNDGAPPEAEQRDGKGWHYHTMQRKLLRMETADALKIRGVVLLVMGLVLAGGVWAAWYVLSWGWRVASRMAA